jgi:hypothetical protein
VLSFVGSIVTPCAWHYSIRPAFFGEAYESFGFLVGLVVVGGDFGDNEAGVSFADQVVADVDFIHGELRVESSELRDERREFRDERREYAPEN